MAALAADSQVLDRTGHLFSSWELARHYRFTDEDGRRPDWGEFEPDFFFDDQVGHVESAAVHVPAGQVAAGIASALAHGS